MHGLILYSEWIFYPFLVTSFIDQSFGNSSSLNDTALSNERVSLYQLKCEDWCHSHNAIGKTLWDAVKLMVSDARFAKLPFLLKNSNFVTGKILSAIFLEGAGSLCTT